MNANPNKRYAIPIHWNHKNSERNLMTKVYLHKYIKYI